MSKLLILLLIPMMHVNSSHAYSTTTCVGDSEYSSCVTSQICKSPEETNRNTTTSDCISTDGVTTCSNSN